MKPKTIIKLVGMGGSCALLAVLIGVCLYAYYEVMPVKGWYEKPMRRQMLSRWLIGWMNF